MTLLVTFLAVLVTFVTLAPLSGTHHWWVRMWDFPRVQIAIVQALLAALAPWFLQGALLWTVLAATLAGLVFHLARIRPFTPLHRTEMRFALPRGDGAEVTLVAANVLMENDRHDLVRALIERTDPDVVLLMETDQVWLEGVRPALAAYPTVIEVPKDDYYGMIFATRLDVLQHEVAFLTPDETPSVWAELRTPSGEVFRFVGLHPEPPVPGVDTDERDAQILFAARFARATDIPLIVMGDFNDAAWSPSSRLFKHYGRYLDPRIGRGLFASFHAKNPLIRCAIDQLFVTEEVAMVDFRLGEKTGSDHFPVVARVRIDPEEARRLNDRPKPMTPEERDEIEARIEEYRTELAKVRDPGSEGSRPAMDAR
jgi:endonuclease/exonuclease/phosphatase (EEP) superfamily protein YafD